MTEPGDPPLPDIDGADAVAARYGRWISFHDAEIREVHIERDGRSTVTVTVVDPVAAGDSLTFVFDRILELSLAGEDVNSQNVIGALAVDRVGNAIKVTFSPCYGLAGHIVAERVSVRPG